MFASTAYAQTATPAPGGAPSGPGDLLSSPLVMMIPLIALFYFMIIRPQMKAAKEQRAMIAALQKGDEVITSGGIVGKISKVSDTFVSVEIAPNTEITVQKQAVQSALPKGTIKSL